MTSLDRIPKEEMHFQPLENIAENQEESGGHHPNMALFNRLLNVAPSPSGFMGGALRRTSAQLQRLRRSPSIDLCTSDDESGKIGKGGSLPSGLGQDTQSTVCSLREEKSARTPLLEVQFGAEQQERRGGGYPAANEKKGVRASEGMSAEEWRRREERGRGESTWGETHAPASLLPPPPQSSKQTSTQSASSVSFPSCHPSAFLIHPTAHSSLEHCSSQPAINQSRAAVPAIPKPPSGRNKMSFLTVPSYDEPQRFRSVSMGSELTGS